MKTFNEIMTLWKAARDKAHNHNHDTWYEDDIIPIPIPHQFVYEVMKKDMENVLTKLYVLEMRALKLVQIERTMNENT